MIIKVATATTIIMIFYLVSKYKLSTWHLAKFILIHRFYMRNGQIVNGIKTNIQDVTQWERGDNY